MNALSQSAGIKIEAGNPDRIKFRYKPDNTQIEEIIHNAMIHAENIYGKKFRNGGCYISTDGKQNLLKLYPEGSTTRDGLVEVELVHE